MFIGYSGGDDIVSLSTSMGFPTSLPVRGVNGEIKSSWSALFTPTPSPTISINFQTAGIISSGSPTLAVWTGALNGGTTDTSFNCADWSSTAVSGIFGSSSSTTSTWLRSSSLGCSFNFHFVCACYWNGNDPTASPTVPTKTPTKNPTKHPTIHPTKFPTPPTKSPTNNPTTNPTIAPQQVLIYDATPTGTPVPSIGNRASANAICTAAPVTAVPACSSKLALISYSPTDAVNTLAIPASYPVKGPNGSQIKSSWSTLLSAGADISLNTAGLSVSSFWTGSTTSGASSGTDCSDWASTSGNGGATSTTVTGLNWIYTFDLACSSTSIHLLCACVWDGTASPTTATPTFTYPNRFMLYQIFFGGSYKFMGQLGARNYPPSPSPTDYPSTQFCLDSAGIPAACSSPTIRALISYNTDNLKDIPNIMGTPSATPTLPVYGPTGTLIQPTFGGMFAPSPGPYPSITASFIAAGVIGTSHPSSTPTWWSGSSLDGTSSNNCVEWTSTSGSNAGYRGDGAQTIAVAGWLSNIAFVPSGTACSVENAVVCICYAPASN
jgi:hypothetical protein